MYPLVGPTASGKSDLAHRLSDELGYPLLSIDSMMVYRGMDIGTAKPSAEEIKRYNYAGLNLVNPDQDFSTGAFLEAIREQLTDQPVIAAGGTGLYLQAIASGIGESAPVDAFRRSELEAMELSELRKMLPDEVLARVVDPENPRRLIRAIERHEAGLDLPDQWTDARVRVPVLRWSRERLSERIFQRVEIMVERGLLEEVQGLQTQYPEWTGTAKQAIGYAEALAHLEGEWTRDEMVERIGIRTRQYAKRQRTWFRNQVAAVEVDMEGDGDHVAAVRAVWEETGPLWFERNARSEG